jgi:hypothetical protein
MAWHRGRSGVHRPGSRLRRWLVGIGIAAVALEAVSVVATHLLHGDALAHLINERPERFRIERTSARSDFPGFVTVARFEIRGSAARSGGNSRPTTSTGASASCGWRSRPLTSALPVPPSSIHLVKAREWFGAQLPAAVPR